jgi:hypothetical protein
MWLEREFASIRGDTTEGGVMAQLTVELEQRLARIPHDLQSEFPQVPTQTIELSVEEQKGRLMEQP